MIISLSFALLMLTLTKIPTAVDEKNGNSFVFAYPDFFKYKKLILWVDDSSMLLT
jgi:hypothetical protein